MKAIMRTGRIGDVLAVWYRRYDGQGGCNGNGMPQGTMIVTCKDQGSRDAMTARLHNRVLFPDTGTAIWCEGSTIEIDVNKQVGEDVNAPARACLNGSEQKLIPGTARVNTVWFTEGTHDEHGPGHRDDYCRQYDPWDTEFWVAPAEVARERNRGQTDRMRIGRETVRRQREQNNQ